MNKWRISAAHIAAACLIVVIATTTGMAAMISTPAMLVQHQTEHPKANDGHDQLVPTGEATNKLPLIVSVSGLIDSPFTCSDINDKMRGYVRCAPDALDL